MPTGVHIRDAREQLFEAAQRVLLRDGPGALTSRAVTTEAGCAKGVLHRHFTDFDAFLTELIHERIVGITDQTVTLRAAAGTGTVTGNLGDAVTTLFDPVAVAVVALVIFRDDLRARLRWGAFTPGIPILAEGTAMLAAYLTEECELGRIAADADVDALAITLIGAGHLLYADRGNATPDAAAVGTVVEAVMADAVQRRLL